MLSDGPDPSVDPVGYALAQIKPLRALRTSDAALRGDIDGLADALQAFVVAGGRGAQVRTVVNDASRRIDAICPGVAVTS